MTLCEHSVGTSYLVELCLSITGIIHSATTGNKGLMLQTPEYSSVISREIEFLLTTVIMSF